MNTIIQSRVLASLLSSSLRSGTLLAQQSTPEGNPPAPHLEQEARDAKLRKAIEKGATMEEIAALQEPTAKTPEEAIHLLKAGNSRFFGGHAQRSEKSANERRAQILGQAPFAVVLGCSDSRVPIELVYDQGFGDIFGVRVAGQIVEPGTVGSIEYAVAHLHTKAVVVMGHEGCGAVKAAMLDEAKIKKEPANVQFLINEIAPAVRNIPPFVMRRQKCAKRSLQTSVDRWRR